MRLGSAPDFDPSAVTMRYVVHPEDLESPLACIAHKSSEICERCRLRQQNPPATPDNSAAFWEEEFKNSLFRFIILNHALRQTRRRLFKSFPARNERVNSPSA